MSTSLYHRTLWDGLKHSSQVELQRQMIDMRDERIKYLETQLELAQLELSKCEDDLDTANMRLSWLDEELE